MYRIFALAAIATAVRLNADKETTTAKTSLVPCDDKNDDGKIDYEEAKECGVNKKYSRKVARLDAKGKSAKALKRYRKWEKKNDFENNRKPILRKNDFGKRPQPFGLLLALNENSI